MTDPDRKPTDKNKIVVKGDPFIPTRFKFYFVLMAALLLILMAFTFMATAQANDYRNISGTCLEIATEQNELILELQTEANNCLIALDQCIKQ